MSLVEGRRGKINSMRRDLKGDLIQLPSIRKERERGGGGGRSNGGKEEPHREARPIKFASGAGLGEREIHMHHVIVFDPSKRSHENV